MRKRAQGQCVNEKQAKRAEGGACQKGFPEKEAFRFGQSRASQANTSCFVFFTSQIAMRAWAACAFSVPNLTPWVASRAGSIVRSCAARANTLGDHAAEAELLARQRNRPSPPVLLRDIFSTRRGGGELSGAGKRALQRLDRLQEVANLALEDRAAGPGGEPWGCADIGADHGLLAICLHANGASVIAGDRAAGPLGVARENFRIYLRRTRKDFSSAIAPPREDGAPRLQRVSGLFDTDAKLRERRVQGAVSEGIGEEEFVAAADLPRLECRLGDGLAVLEEGEVNTVCIAGVGVKTIIQILSANDGGGVEEAIAKGFPKETLRDAPLLSRLGVQRLVLQPMDARLEYMRDLRVWLRENGWRITQETIVSTLGKGGNHAFLTLRADFAGNVNCLDGDRGRPAWQSDWLGSVLPARATDLRGERREENRQEAAIFLAYLKHQRDWLRAIERARSPSAGDGERPGSQGGAMSEGVDEVVLAVEDAIQQSEGYAGKVDTAQPLVTARRWRRSA